MAKSIPMIYTKDKFVIPKNTVYQIQFNGNNPNYYRVSNLGETVLYFATNNTPREDLYDFKCSPNSTANFCEIFTRDFLYCLNPGDTDVEILLTYWTDKFDPAFIAFGEGALNVEGTVKTDGVINEIKTSLPAGNNTIGYVQIYGNVATQVRTINSNSSITKNNSMYIPNISNVVKNISSNIRNINSNLQLIRDKVVDNISIIHTFHEYGQAGGSTPIHSFDRFLPLTDDIKTLSKSLIWTVKNSSSSDITLYMRITADNGDFLYDNLLQGGSVEIPEGRTINNIEIWNGNNPTGNPRNVEFYITLKIGV